MTGYAASLTSGVSGCCSVLAFWVMRLFDLRVQMVWLSLFLNRVQFSGC
ncbi:hypothetical protein M595_2011 [Lyngbya aestuarii BL J]|uniref:Uncharacterized protein n=1 Tax=Lyngbya aestuarii BL J TaxID=1348334 RepID=U7QLM4_9CYAN|nr:hypothetical protein M595_2011 [Lyngbya aestuarii BL J]